jgi:hypothetical protein
MRADCGQWRRHPMGVNVQMYQENDDQFFAIGFLNSVV